MFTPPRPRLILALLLSSSSAFAQSFDEKVSAFVAKYDRNGNGQVERNEFPNEQKARFHEMDVNKDGWISRQEAREFFMAEKDPPGADPKKKPPMRKRREFRGLESFGDYDLEHEGRFDRKEFSAYLFAMCDRNNDEQLDIEELQNIPVPDKKGGLRDGLARRALKDLDKDGDRFLSAEEWLLPEEIFQAFDDNGDGFVSKDELIQDQLERAGGLVGWTSADEIMTRMDANKDGKLSKEEWQGTKALWDRLGPSKEGFVTKEQLERHLAYLQGILLAANDFVQRYDKNGDRRVTREEFGGSDAVFDRCDTNHDGILSAEDGAGRR